MRGHLFQGSVHPRKAGAPSDQDLEAYRQRLTLRRLRLLPIGLQSAVQLPDSLTDPRDGGAVGLAEGQHLGEQPLLVDPAQGMHQHVELARVIADDD